MPDDVTIAERLDRLESAEQIRQLAAKYALAVDMCDFDALADLYVEDVKVGAGLSGRAHLRAFFATVLAQFDATAHLIGNHIIELCGDGRAEGVVYCLAQHEMAGTWIDVQAMYHDWYERQDGQWLFVRRTPLLWYASEHGVAPLGPEKVRWPGQARFDGGMHAYGPAWAAVHGDPPAELPEWVAAAGASFLERIRRGGPVPRPQVPGRA